MNKITEDLRIRVFSEEESREVQELAFKDGFYWRFGSYQKIQYTNYFYIYLYVNNRSIGADLHDRSFSIRSSKRVTLPELRQMVLGVPIRVPTGYDFAKDIKGTILEEPTFHNIKPSSGCECGATACGLLQHSDYCPMYEDR